MVFPSAQHAFDRAGEFAPFRSLFRQTRPPCVGQVVILAHARAVRRPLVGLHQPLILQRVQQRIQRARLERKRVVRPLAQAIDNLLAVQIVLLEQAQDEQPRAPREQAFVNCHGPSLLISVFDIIIIYRQSIYVKLYRISALQFVKIMLDIFQPQL